MFLLAVAAISKANSEQDDQLVLVATKASDFEPLSQVEIRRLFLGKTLKVNGLELRPIINNSDEKVHKVFLQNIIFMTETSYNRQVIKRTVKYGETLPETVKDINSLIEEFEHDDDHYCVSYMWLSDVDENENIRVIQTLWKGSK